MDNPLINFESSWKKNIEKEQIREARKKVLEKAKADFEKEERKKQDAIKRGEGIWMLPALNEQIALSQEELTKTKKKKKKEKKEKKKKKSKKKSSSSDSEEELQWAEKGKVNEVENKNTDSSATKVVGPTLQRDSWMVSPFDVLPTTSKAEIRAKKQEEKEKEREVKELMEHPGRNEKELNPYWKDGGTGLPSTKTEAAGNSGKGAAGDGGYSWLLKSYQRCEQQAKEEGRSLEQVAAERYGSLKKLQKMLDDAKQKASASSRDDRSALYKDGRDRDDSRRRDKDQGHREHRRSRSPDGSRRGFRKPTDDGDDQKQRYKGRGSPDRDRRGFKKPTDDNDDHQKPRDSRSGFRRPGDDSRLSRYEGHRHGNNDSRKSADNSSRFKRPRDSDESDSDSARNKRDRRHRDRRRGRGRSSSESSVSDEEERRDRSRRDGRHNDRRGKERSSSESSDSGEEERRDRSSRRDERHKDSRSQPSRSAFKRPGSDSDEDRKDSSSRRLAEEKNRSRYEASCDKDRGARDSRDSRSRPSWRKKGFSPPPDRKTEEEKEEKMQQKKQAETSSSSSESSSESEEESEPQQVEELPPLTEEEKNQLGAKLLKAEIMGDTELANQLKARLNAAHTQPSRKPGAAAPASDEEEEVVLTRTTGAGVTMPLGKRKHAKEPKRGKRKREKISTHDTEGKRAQYFQDDSKYSLQDLVSREKMGTAEDSNMMFARLAGKAGAQKTNDDYQLDDAMMTAATKKISEAKLEDREHQKAIFEHRKIAAAIEKCRFCFDKYPKHLMVAIGKKVFLALPNHRSLAEGHCYIVPIQHNGPGTVLDEDVWEEIQLFRQSLVRLFETDDEDCVFMETSKNLQHHPHMHLECVPVPREVGDMAPIYFKKALLESESEWAQNKQVVELKGRDVRRAIPKGLPYFSVDFGMQSGFAHVIEDEKSFPFYFGREVVGGMIDADHQLWRKPHKEDFETQRQKVLKFAKVYKPYDWTKQPKETS